MDNKHRPIWENPVFLELLDRRVNAFNELSDRLEGLKLPRKVYRELLSGMRELENAVESFVRFRTFNATIHAAVRIPVYNIDVDAIYQCKEGM